MGALESCCSQKQNYVDRDEISSMSVPSVINLQPCPFSRPIQVSGGFKPQVAAADDPVDIECFSPLLVARGESNLARIISVDSENNEERQSRVLKRGSTFIHEAKLLDYQSFRGIQPIEDISSMYQWTKVLGVGASGEVHEALNLKANVRCAMKIMKKRKVCRD